MKLRAYFGFPAITALVLVFGTYAKATELRPLNDVLEQESSEATMLYAINRCSGLHLAMASVLKVRQSPAYSDAIEKYVQSSAKLMSIAITYANEQNLNLKPTDIRDSVSSIFTLYQKRMTRNHNATGNLIDGLIKEDLKLCDRG